MSRRPPPLVRIQTDRLILRPLELGDLNEVLALHEQPAVVEFMGYLSRERAVERLTHCERQWRERGHDLLAVIERASGRFLGRTGLRHWPQFEETEVGWVLRREQWGRGYATEAARACLEWGFARLPVPYITAMIRPDNTRSLGVAWRLGMRPIRQDVLVGVPVIVHAAARGRSDPLLQRPPHHHVRPDVR